MKSNIFFKFLLFIMIIECILISCTSHSDSKNIKAKNNIAYFEKVLKRFFNDHKRYPTTNEGLKFLINKIDPSGNSYLNGLVSDPWGNPYNYRCPGKHNKDSYDLWSYGADNSIGGVEYNADITNWD